MESPKHGRKDVYFLHDLMTNHVCPARVIVWRLQLMESLRDIFECRDGATFVGEDEDRVL
jgi:hypothetical protein